MLLEMESKMDANSESDSQHKEDSNENASGTSINQSTTNDRQLNKIPTVEIASIPEEGKAIKVQELDVCIAGDSVEVSVSNRILNIEDGTNHRQNVQYSSDSSDFESEESSDDDDEFFRNLHKNVRVTPAKVHAVLETEEEIVSVDLPPVEDLCITENATNLEIMGRIEHICKFPESKEYYVTVRTDGNSNPLDEDSVLFLSPDIALGKIDEVFGSVHEPKYVVRFNKPEDIHNKDVTKDQKVYYSPSNDKLTHYVLVDTLKQNKGSDASWMDNNEPPDDQVEYSDDEQEKISKQKRRAKNRKYDRDCDAKEEDKDVAPNKMERRKVICNQERSFEPRPSRNNFRSPIPGSPSSSPHAYSSPRSFGSTPSPPQTFSPGTSNQQRNGLLSQPLLPTTSNTGFGHFLRRSVSQSFVPSPQSNVPTFASFALLTQNRVKTPQSIGAFSQSSAPPYQSVTPPPTAHVLPHLVSRFTTGAPQQNPSFLMPAPQINVPSSQSFISLPQTNMPNPTSPGPFTQNRVQTPTSLGYFMQRRVQTPQSFGAFSQNSVPSYPSFTPPPNAHVLVPPQLASGYATGSPQQNPSSLMPAPQNNVPLQQQILLQSQQPVGNFFSHPPSNYIAF